MRAILLLLLPCASHAKQDPWASRVLAPAPASAADAPTLHLPIVNVGLPKSGSSSVEDYFLCGGNGTLNVSHWNCATMLSASQLDGVPHVYQMSPTVFQVPCGDCVKKNVEAGRPPLASCGGYDVWAQIDVQGWPDGASCYLPQVSALEELHAAYPNASFVLPTRPVAHWVASVSGWLHDGSSEMRYRLERCGLPGIGVNASDADFEAFYTNHSRAVREFVAAHPSHALIEFDLEQPTAGEHLAAATGLPAKCWGKSNAATEANAQEWAEMALLATAPTDLALLAASSPHALR